MVNPSSTVSFSGEIKSNFGENRVTCYHYDSSLLPRKPKVMSLNHHTGKRLSLTLALTLHSQPEPGKIPYSQKGKVGEENKKILSITYTHLLIDCDA